MSKESKARKAQAEQEINAFHEALKSGHPVVGSKGRPSAIAIAAESLGLDRRSLEDRVGRIGRMGLWERQFGLKPDWSLEVVSVTSRAQIKRRIIADAPDLALEAIPSAAFIAGAKLELVSRPDNTFIFGAAGDLHAASKYTRWDVREDLYRQFIEAGAQCNFDTGNWIDGEAHFNRYDLEVHGIDRQCRLLAERHPKGLKTYAIWGDDHEGWYVQREGIDVGRYCEGIMQSTGHDWIDLGFMEAHVNLKNYNTGKMSSMAVVHPGGGSAYAISYSIQKILECVPLSAEILTPTGWRKYNEISIGSVVLGYNIQKDRCEWTTVSNINVGYGELIKYSNDQFTVECTDNHKWAIEWESRAGPNKNSRVPSHYYRRDRIIQTIDQTRPRSRIIQAAVAPDGPGMAHLGPKEWLQKSNSVATVMSLTSGERRAFIEAMMLGEGTIGGSHNGRTLMFSQRPGPVADAFRIACFLEGIATTEKECPPGSFKPDGNPTLRITMLQKRMRICDKLKRKEIGVAKVWCPTTDLGTWVMRQGKTITITGNSLEGGEKPGVGLYGHYHKLWSGVIRNIFVAQTGTQQDQTPFMRKKRLEAHVGGLLIKLRQDPRTGAILSMTPEIIRYFNTGYYVGATRWSRHGDVKMMDRNQSGIEKKNEKGKA